jgi:hypothetical protein
MMPKSDRIYKYCRKITARMLHWLPAVFQVNAGAPRETYMDGFLSTFRFCETINPLIFKF